MKKMTPSIIIGILFLLVCVGCAKTGTPVGTQPPAPTATVEEQPLPEPAEATATPEPMATAEPTEVPPLPCNIAFDTDRDGNREVYRMGPDGSNPVNLTNHPADDFDPSWSADGSQIAFVSNRETDAGEGQFIYVMSADGSDVRQLSTEGGSNHPDWSPTGEFIVYDNDADIFIIKADGSEPAINLTDSPEKDIMPDWSPFDHEIAWLSGTDDNRNIRIINLQTLEVRQITESGKIYEVKWSVDGRLFTHWDHPEGVCFNCVINADGSNVADAGGKGVMQEYLPFWTLDGERVECVNANFNDEPFHEIYLVGEIFPDIFFNLTNNPADDRNPDWAAKCGPGAAQPVNTGEPAQGKQPVNPQDIVIGYDVNPDSVNPQKLEDLHRACEELQIECIQNDGISGLVEQGVDAIITFSNRWDVMGDFPQIWDAAGGQKIPVIVLNAESDSAGAYNLSIDSVAMRSSLEWMFTEMGGSGEFVYFIFGGNSFHQSVMDEVLKEYPGIQATSMPADYQGNSFTPESIVELVASNPNLGAMWTDENVNVLMDGLGQIEGDQFPLILCGAREDFLLRWKEMKDTNPAFKCTSFIPPGGTAYEGIYVAYYMLTGAQIDPDAMGGKAGNTFLYDYPVITNENLEELLEKMDAFREGDWGFLELPPMTPEEILAKWFLE